MTVFSQSQVRRLSAVHGWSGMVLGLLLYAVIFTGTVVVFHDEIADWSVGGQVKEAPLVGNLDEKVRSRAEAVSKGYHERVFVFSNDRGELLVFPHARVFNEEHGHTAPYGSLFRVDPLSGETIARHEGFVFETPSWFRASAISDFLVELHVNLHIAEPWGDILVGVLGLLSMFAGVSGVIMHRHLIRDMFVAIRRGERLVSFRDRHILAGTWSLPFAFLLGFTGAYFIFFSLIFLPLLSHVAFGGDEEKMVTTLVEPRVEVDARPMPVANLDTVIADATRRAGGPPYSIFVERWGRADSRIRTFHMPAPGGLARLRAVYDGVSGDFLEFRPVVGNVPSAGGTVFSLMGPLHFGDFAGVLSKSVWVGLGSAMAFVVISGLRMWVRRREDDTLWRRFGRAVTTVGYGLPAAMLTCVYAYFLSLALGGDTFWWTPAGFLIGLIPGVVPGFVMRDEDGLRRFYRRLLGVGLILLPIVRMATGGLDWTAAFVQGQGTVLSVDLTLLLLGAGLVWWARGTRALPAPEPDPAPAE